MPKIRTVLFDGGGTIFDDLDVMLKTISTILDYYGLKEISLSEFKQEFCMPYWKFFMSRGLDESKAISETPHLFSKNYDVNKVKLFPDVINTLDSLKNVKDMRIGLVSQMPRIIILDLLERFSISKYFDVIVGLEDSKIQKPSSLPILTALSYKSSKNKIIYVGDMREDIQAAKKAKVLSVAINGKRSYHDLNLLTREKPDFIITKLSELPLIVEQFENQTE